MVINMKIALCGAQGKMGTECKKYFNEKYDIIDFNHNHPCLITKIKEVDIVVDFTKADSAFINAVIALTNQKPIIIGTTGLTDEQKICLRKISNNKNSMFVNPQSFYRDSMDKNNIEALKNNLPNTAISETHSINKLDTPSGTAIAFAQLLKIDQKEIVSHRIETSDAIHQLLFHNNDEEIMIIHKVKNRHAYMMQLEYYIKNIFEYNGYNEL